MNNKQEEEGGMEEERREERVKYIRELEGERER